MKARISYALGRTIATANFENARIDVSMECQCEEDEADECYRRAKRFVDAKIKREEERWRSSE